MCVSSATSRILTLSSRITLSILGAYSDFYGRDEDKGFTSERLLGFLRLQDLKEREREEILVGSRFLRAGELRAGLERVP